MRSLLLASAFLLSSSAFAYGGSAMSCPKANEFDHYVESDLFPDLAKIAATQNIPNLKLHADQVSSSAGLKLQIYFDMISPYDPSKELLILIPGGPGSDHKILHDLGTDLAKNPTLHDKFNIVAMDHRGLGCSRPIFPGHMPALSYEMRFAATDIEMIRRSLGTAKVNLVGGSYGTMLAQTYALLFPQNIDRLFLRGAVSSAQQMANWDQTFLTFLADNPKAMATANSLKSLDTALANLFLDRAFGELYTYRGRAKNVSDLAEKLQPFILQKDLNGLKQELQVPIDDVAPPMTRALTCLELFPFPPEDGGYHVQRDFKYSCGEFNGLFDYFDYRPSLSLLPARTMIWAGRYDVVTPASAAEFLHAAVPGSYLYVDPHLGHSPKEKTDCFTSLIAAFLTDQGAGAYDKIVSSAKCTAAPSLAAPPPRYMPEFSGL